MGNLIENFVVESSENSLVAGNFVAGNFEDNFGCSLAGSFLFGTCLGRFVGAWEEVGEVAVRGVWELVGMSAWEEEEVEGYGRDAEGSGRMVCTN